MSKNARKTYAGRGDGGHNKKGKMLGPKDAPMVHDTLAVSNKEIVGRMFLLAGTRALQVLFCQSSHSTDTQTRNSTKLGPHMYKGK